jgi:hypothetical protein
MGVREAKSGPTVKKPNPNGYEFVRKRAENQQDGR